MGLQASPEPLKGVLVAAQRHHEAPILASASHPLPSPHQKRVISTDYGAFRDRFLVPRRAPLAASRKSVRS